MLVKSFVKIEPEVVPEDTILAARIRRAGVTILAEAARLSYSRISNFCAGRVSMEKADYDRLVETLEDFEEKQRSGSLTHEKLED